MLTPFELPERIRCEAPEGSSESDTTMTPLQMRLKTMNDLPGNGAPCPICKGKGMIFVERDGAVASRDCECTIRRRSLLRVQRSGLGELYDVYTLERYDMRRPWQRTIRRKAEAYIAGRQGWFFISGRSGSGKTHILFAIARELLEAGLETRYFMWRNDVRRLKELIGTQECSAEMQDLADCKVLLIDDLWKGGATDSDQNLAYELLNARYMKPSCLTLICSELPLEEICAINEAMGTRIAERGKGYILQTGDENLRLSQ